MDEIKAMFGEILGAIRRIENRLDGLDTRSGAAAVANNGASSSGTHRKQSVKEFLIELEPDGAVQTTLAIAYYIEIFDGITPFNVADLEKGFRAAKESVPTNINDKVYMNIKNGHMTEAEEKKGGKKAWVITRTGEQYVKSKFKKAADK